MQPTRFVTLDPAQALPVLTATARGMIEHTFIRAAQRAWTELMNAVAGAGRLSEVRSRIGLMPDEPRGPNDAGCRYQAGVLFGYDLAAQHGTCLKPPIALSGTLAWEVVAPGRYAVFRHVGPYETLHHSWDAVVNGWLAGSGHALRAAPALELSLDSLNEVPPEQLRTEIWIPLA